jgi:hypothetical protein
MGNYLKKLRDENEAANSPEKKRGTGHAYTYTPNKKARRLRAHIWDRFQRMKSNPIRKEAEMDWEQGDKKARLWRPEKDPDDWRADIRLPDAFAAIQTHLQETVGMKLRPSLKPIEGSDTGLAYFFNSVMNYNLERTDFDPEVIRALRTTAIRGTAFTVEEYLYETRNVKDPTSVRNGVLEYTEREIVDKDDTYTRYWDNENVFIDEAADVIDVAEDCVLVEKLRFDSWKNKYGDRDGFYNTDKVVPCGSLSERTNYFDMSEDELEGDYVQTLHYYNKMTDTYGVLANTVVIYEGPIPFKHKELPVAVWNYYPVEGRIYGMGIPKIISPTQEEREAIRNLSLDRQKMHLNKMFLVNDLFDLNEDEATTRPHGFIHVNTGGLSLDQVIRPLEYGDVPGSSIRMDDQLRDDEKRSTGIDDRSQGVNMGGTATEAAILTEQSQKRINLINSMIAMNTIKRIGRLKWSNIQFFYKAPRIEMITEDNEEREKKVYRTIPVNNQKIELVNDGGTKKVKLNPYTGTSSFKLDSKHARFLDEEGDVMVQWDIKALMPQSIRQSRYMEMFQTFIGNPVTMGEMNVRDAMKDVLMENEFDPKTWMSNDGLTDGQMIKLARFENEVMLKGEPLDPTKNATPEHTEETVKFMQSEDFKKAAARNPALPLIFERHVQGEIDAQGGAQPAADGDVSGLPGGPPPPGAGGNAPPPPPPEVAAALQAMGGAAPGQVAEGNAVTQEMNMGA